MKHHYKLRNNIKVALVGIGSICLNIHAPLLKKLKVNVVYAVDVDNNALKKIKKIFPDIKTTQTLENITEKEATCAIVATPTGLHYRHVKYLLSKGVHVLCEKPLTTTAKESQKLIQLATEKKLTLQVGYYRRFQPATQYIKKILHNENVTLGKLTSVIILGGHIFSSQELPYYLEDKKLSGGGCMMDFGVHMIDLLLFWFDEIKIEKYKDDSKGGIEANAITKGTGIINFIQFPFTLLISRTNNLGYEVYFKFENSTIVYNFNKGNELKLLSRPMKISEKSHLMHTNIQLEEIPLNYFFYFEKQWEEFIKRIHGSKEKISNIEDAIHTTFLIELCYQMKKRQSLLWEQLFINNDS